MVGIPVISIHGPDLWHCSSACLRARRGVHSHTVRNCYRQRDRSQAEVGTSNQRKTCVGNRLGRPPLSDQSKRCPASRRQAPRRQSGRAIQRIQPAPKAGPEDHESNMEIIRFIPMYPCQRIADMHAMLSEVCRHDNRPMLHERTIAPWLQCLAGENSFCSFLRSCAAYIEASKFPCAARAIIAK